MQVAVVVVQIWYAMVMVFSCYVARSAENVFPLVINGQEIVKANMACLETFVLSLG